VPSALYYRQQAKRFEQVADQCSIPELVPYYRQMAFDYLARAVRAEAASAQAKDDGSSRRATRESRGRRRA
jgi:hypothetical protein